MPRLVTFGEAMLRIAPTDDPTWGRGQPSSRCTAVTSIGGDELNVAVALKSLGWDSEWTSVVPAEHNAMAEVMMRCVHDAGIRADRVHRAKDGVLGIFYVLPDEKRVQYQRRFSSFRVAQPVRGFDWPTILSQPEPCDWVHATGITPLCGAAARAQWKAHLRAAAALSVPISIDLNHRPALGTLDNLWDVVAPHLANVYVLILSTTQILGLMRLMKIQDPSHRGTHVPATSSPAWPRMMRALYRKLAGPAIVCCFKSRDASGLQTRWSVVCDAAGTHSTRNAPVLHRPLENIGGGSAFAAGLIDRLAAGRARGEDGATLWIEAAHRGDLLAALCQETLGDFSTVQRSELSAAEAALQRRSETRRTPHTDDPPMARL
jgi:sugar/nucleoside kinase (ribokinase family)